MIHNAPRLNVLCSGPDCVQQAQPITSQNFLRLHTGTGEMHDFCSRECLMSFAREAKRNDTR